MRNCTRGRIVEEIFVSRPGWRMFAFMNAAAPRSDDDIMHHIVGAEASGVQRRFLIMQTAQGSYKKINDEILGLIDACGQEAA